MAWKWYGVKTVYRTTALGKPRKADAFYDSKSSLVEERIVLFRARSHAEALARAGEEAVRYAASDTHLNRYGQKVRQRFLHASDSFEMFDAPCHGKEVFSATEVVPNSVPDSEILANWMGRERREDSWIRTKFLNREFSGELGFRIV